MQPRQLGQIRIDRIVESICADFEPLSFFPETTPADWEPHREWMQPRAMDPASGNIILTIQGFLLRTSRHTILVDTCVGDHKPRPHRPQWDMLKLNTFLPRLAQVGVSPADVDYVMCTHLHWDHVGWNTQLQNGRWVPTFPQCELHFRQAGIGSLGRVAPQGAAAALYGQYFAGHRSGQGTARGERLRPRR